MLGVTCLLRGTLLRLFLSSLHVKEGGSVKCRCLLCCCIGENPAANQRLIVTLRSLAQKWGVVRGRTLSQQGFPMCPLPASPETSETPVQLMKRCTGRSMCKDGIYFSTSKRQLALPWLTRKGTSDARGKSIWLRAWSDGSLTALC